MNANIFENNEDVLSSEHTKDDPTIFEDFQNPLQSSIAIAYFLWKNGKEVKLDRIFTSGESHAKFLATIQE